MQIDYVGIGAAILVPLGRCIGGWLVKSLEDNKITKFEVRKLAETGIKTIVLGTMLYLGLQGFGLDLELVSVAATAVILDIGLSAFKENLNVKK